MAYEFKNLNEIPAQDAPTENTTVMAFEAGQPKQIPAGKFGGKGLVVDLRGYTLNTDGQPNIISDINYDPIYEAIIAGQNVVFRVHLGDIDTFAEALFSGVVPEQGFTAGLYSPDRALLLTFTNGSYNTTA